MAAWDKVLLTSGFILATGVSLGAPVGGAGALREGFVQVFSVRVEGQLGLHPLNRQRRLGGDPTPPSTRSATHEQRGLWDI